MSKQNQLLQACFESLADCRDTRTRYQYSLGPDLSKNSEGILDRCGKKAIVPYFEQPGLAIDRFENLNKQQRFLTLLGFFCKVENLITGKLEAVMPFLEVLNADGKKHLEESRIAATERLANNIKNKVDESYKLMRVDFSFQSPSQSNWEDNMFDRMREERYRGVPLTLRDSLLRTLIDKHINENVSFDETLKLLNEIYLKHLKSQVVYDSKKPVLEILKGKE